MKRILVADDNASCRELLRAVLEHLGHSVWEAGDGTEAVRCAREISPDIVFLDLRMPGLDGFGVLQELRSEGASGCVIVALTASAMKGDRERAMAAGFTRYLTKPISLKELRNEMAAHA